MCVFRVYCAKKIARLRKSSNKATSEQAHKRKPPHKEAGVLKKPFASIENLRYQNETNRLYPRFSSEYSRGCHCASVGTYKLSCLKLRERGRLQRSTSLLLIENILSSKNQKGQSFIRPL